MSRPELNVFYHPTTTIFIDDDKNFLDQLTLRMSSDIPYLAFSDPQEGLAYADSFYGHNQKADTQSASSTVVCEPTPGFPAAGYRGGTGLDQYYKLRNHRRFSEPSVLVIDYDMPGINGLDACARISNPKIKKVLLTGAADTAVAIHALNTELIDFFIAKDEGNLAERLNHVIAQMQSRYFHDITSSFKDNSAVDLPYFDDSALADYIEHACEEFGAVEYYFMTNPAGFLLVNAAGSMSRLVMYTEKQLEQQIAIAQQQGISEALLKPLHLRQAVPFYDHSQPLVDSFLNALHPAEKIEGKQPYYGALLDHLSPDMNTLLRQSLTFNEYMSSNSYHVH